jgi:hypothetical protein
MATEKAVTKKKAAPAGQGKRTAPGAKGQGKKACTVGGCARGYRAKGFCFFHYKKWRAGELPHARYKTCSTADCRKKVAEHGLCDEHLKSWKASRKGAKAVEAAAPVAA